MRRFDYSFLEKESIPSNIASMLFAIGRNKTTSDVFKEKYPNVFNNLVKIAKVQSVKASNAIEGIVTTDQRIKELVNESTEPRNHNEEEIAGYRDVLNRIHMDYQIIDIETRQILLLHRDLLERKQTLDPRPGPMILPHSQNKSIKCWNVLKYSNKQLPNFSPIVLIISASVSNL